MFGKLKSLFNPQSEIKIYAPLSGNVIPIEQINDPIFSEKMLGDGVCIEPDSDKIFAPVNGTIALMFETGHAVNIISDDGVEILIHIGINTIELKGEHYTIHKHTGDSIKVGDLLMEFDIKAIAQKGYDINTPVVICNTEDYKEVVKTQKGRITVGEELLSIVKKS